MRLHKLFIMCILLAVFALFSCSSDGDNTDGDIELDNEIIETDQQEDDMTGGDGIIDGDTKPMDGTWYDSTSNRTWQIPVLDNGEVSMNIYEAKKYCENLNLDEYRDWFLPTINDLRTLIRGCPDTETGGSCRVTDSCLSYDCIDNQCTQSCSINDGPANGCYWPSEMGNKCFGYLSSSLLETEESQDEIWCVWFYDASVNLIIDEENIMCVRKGN